jgi:hypothetical protein
MEGSPKEIFQHVEELQQFGLRPPIEFMAYNAFRKNGSEAFTIENFLLSPIL